MQMTQFESIDLTSLEQVAGGGRIGRKIRNALKNVFEHVTFQAGGEIDPDFEPGDILVGVTVSS
jgi:CRISPR/Cas system type I-B associated protein Csh2 (Cas7 group RAMP superfamily)